MSNAGVQFSSSQLKLLKLCSQTSRQKLSKGPWVHVLVPVQGF